MNPCLYMACPCWHFNRKDLKYLQSQPTHFLNMIIKQRVVLASSLGHHWAADLPLYIKEHYKHMPRMQGENSIKTQKHQRHVKNNYF